jgi:uncharacterized protein (TIGR04255 family)
VTMTSVPPWRRIYENAPIVEAVIDIRCANPQTLSLRNLSGLSEELAPEYVPYADAIEIHEVRTAEGNHSRTERKMGFALRALDEKRIVQFQLEGFAFSRLAPYPRWEVFISEAEHLWQKYKRTTLPVAVRRVGVRYINRLEIGTPVIDDLRPFLNLHPVTPWGLTSPPAGFFMQVKQPQGLGERMLVVNEATVQNTETGRVAIVLDLDAFAERDFDVDDTAIWNLVEELHVSAGAAFEASITDKVRELIR